MPSLVVCRGCSRHVREDESRCPFCGGAELGAPRRLRIETKTLTRAAAMAVGASLAVASACGGSTTDGSDAGPIADASTDDAVTYAPAYGMPSPDASFDAGTDADSGNAAAYGLPPPPQDAGNDGAIVPAYGLPAVTSNE